MTDVFAHRTNWNLAANAYTRALEEHRRAGREVFDLTASNPTTIGLNYRHEELLRALADRRSLVYEPTAKGLWQAREAVAEYYAERGIAISPEDLILTTSTSEAYSFVFRLLCNPGDSVLVPTPSYPLFDFLADLQDVKLSPYELIYDHGWQMDFHSLATAQRAGGRRCHAVLVVHPNNPTGSFVKPGEAEQLSHFCTTRGLAIVADEVFRDYALADKTPITFAQTQTADAPLTFTLSGLSKISGLPQMKVAWIAVAGAEALKSEALSRLEVIADTFLSMNAPVQWAMPALLEERRHIQPQLLQRIRENLAELDRQLGAQKLCSRLAVEGGWYGVLRVPARGSDEALAIALLQQAGVLVQPGHFYDFAGDGYLVLSLITPTAEFREGIRRLLDFVTKM